MKNLFVFMKRKGIVSNLVVSCFFRSKNGHFWQQFWFDKWFIQEFFHSGCWDLNIGPYEWDSGTHPKVHWLLIRIIGKIHQTKIPHKNSSLRKFEHSLRNFFSSLRNFELNEQMRKKIFFSHFSMRNFKHWFYMYFTIN